MDIIGRITGRYYATMKRASISSKFDETTSLSLIGTTLPGKIVKGICDPLDYTIKETGGVNKLSYRWTFNPNEYGSLEDNIYDKEPANSEFACKPENKEAMSLLFLICI